MKIDILVIAAHPDDAELCCAGTIAQQVAMGNSVAILDLTKGEMGTRGTAETRMIEANKSSEILGLTFRENMGFKDYFFKNDLEHQTGLVKEIRKYRPKIILTNAISDRHPDHGKASKLVVDSVFLSGLVKFKTQEDGVDQDAHRPQHIYHFIQNNYLEPDFIVDVSKHWNTKMKSIKAYSSQFYNPESDEPNSFISSKEFLEFIEGRGKALGHRIGAQYGEGFTLNRNIGVKNLFDLI